MSIGFNSPLPIPLGIFALIYREIHGCVTTIDYSIYGATIMDSSYYDLGIVDLSNSDASIVDVICPN